MPINNKSKPTSMPQSCLVQGQLIAANPTNPHDHLSESVILIASHNRLGTIGLQINRVMEDLGLEKVAETLGVEYQGPDTLYFGGSSYVNKINIIHSSEWYGYGTVPLNDQISMTNDVSILAAISQGQGPNNFRACAGYWAWPAGLLDAQLDTRYQQTHPAGSTYKWEIVPATIETVFSDAGPMQWHQILDIATRQQVAAWF